MEAPKKIYLHTQKEPYPSITFSEVEEKNSKNIKYINAETLTKLLENEIMNATKVMDTGIDPKEIPISMGKKAAFVKLLDFIDSL